MTSSLKNAVNFIDLRKRMSEQRNEPPDISEQEKEYIMTQIRTLGGGVHHGNKR